MSGHRHNSCGSEQHDHDHNQPHEHTPPPEDGSGGTLYQYIAHERISTLNESVQNAGRDIVKPWDQRLSDTCVESDADSQLLMHIPFTGMVKLQSILIRSLDSDQAPRSIRLFANREDLDFSAAEELHTTQDIDGIRSGEIIEYSLKASLWNNTRSVTIFIQDNFGAETSRLYYISFKGVFQHLEGDLSAATIIYESAANPADHKFRASGNQIERNV